MTPVYPFKFIHGHLGSSVCWDRPRTVEEIVSLKNQNKTKNKITVIPILECMAVKLWDWMSILRSFKPVFVFALFWKKHTWQISGVMPHSALKNCCWWLSGFHVGSNPSQQHASMCTFLPALISPFEIGKECENHNIIFLMAKMWAGLKVRSQRRYVLLKISRRLICWSLFLLCRWIPKNYSRLVCFLFQYSGDICIELGWCKPACFPTPDL